MKYDPLQVVGFPEIGGFNKMPRNSFAFAVWVSCEVYGIGLFRRFFDLTNQRCAPFDVHVAGFKSEILNIYAKSALWQITNVPHRSFDNVFIAQKPTYGSSLCR